MMLRYAWSFVMEECVGDHLKVSLLVFTMRVSASPPLEMNTHVSDLHCEIAASNCLTEYLRRSI